MKVQINDDIREAIIKALDSIGYKDAGLKQGEDCNSIYFDNVGFCIDFSSNLYVLELCTLNMDCDIEYEEICANADLQEIIEFLKNYSY